MNAPISSHEKGRIDKPLAEQTVSQADIRPYGVSRLDLPSREISREEFGELFKSYKQSAWRLELLTAYAVPNEDAEFDAFLKGAPLPPVSKEVLCGEGPWCQLIRSHIEAGRTMGRVHVLPELLTPYLRYEIEWGYTFNNNAGDDIRLLLPANISSTLRERLNTLQDFWLFDDSKVVLCDYGPNGSFDGAREVLDTSVIESFKAVRSACIDESLDFKSFMRAYRAGKIS